jgi:hypothetical protein
MKSSISLCSSCAASTLVELDAEICIHFRGLAGLGVDPILAFPKLRVCLYCGSIRSDLSGQELQLVREGAARMGQPLTKGIEYGVESTSYET